MYHRLVRSILLCLGAAAAFSQPAVVIDRDVPMAAAHFLHFVTNNRAFLESQGDYIVEVSAWSHQDHTCQGWWPADHAASVRRKRTRFTAPMKTWVGDITAETVKTQELLRSDDSGGLCTHIQYRESDVAKGFPMMKDLELITHWRVTSEPASKECHVQVSAEVKLPRSVSIVAGKIERIVIANAKEYAESMIQFILNDGSNSNSSHNGPLSTSTARFVDSHSSISSSISSSSDSQQATKPRFSLPSLRVRRRSSENTGVIECCTDTNSSNAHQGDSSLNAGAAAAVADESSRKKCSGSNHNWRFASVLAWLVPGSRRHSSSADVCM